MSRFDEEPDGDPHGECVLEIKRLTAELAAIRKEAETNQKWAFLEWMDKAERLTAELATLRATTFPQWTPINCPCVVDCHRVT